MGRQINNIILLHAALLNVAKSLKTKLKLRFPMRTFDGVKINRNKTKGTEQKKITTKRNQYLDAFHEWPYGRV